VLLILEEVEVAQVVQPMKVEMLQTVVVVAEEDLTQKDCVLQMVLLIQEVVLVAQLIIQQLVELQKVGGLVLLL
tara:strand:- start:67 stop:288 length:222 start_codon:yes stop_codon:yes gene_type:complete